MTQNNSGQRARDERVPVHGMEVSKVLYDFANEELLPTIRFDQDRFWRGLADIARELTPRNRELLGIREDFQAKLDEHYRENPGADDPAEHESFLREIGYLVDRPEDTPIRTQNVDDEFATIAGPQLVVPVLNARFALNAANARWGSLYDALYGTDAIPEDGGAEKGTSYNKVRGDKVIAWGRDFLDRILPLDGASHKDVDRYDILDGRLSGHVGDEVFKLADKDAYRGFVGNIDDPSEIILRHNNLHVILQIDPSSPIGSTDRAGVKDIILEAAVSTIIDFEDSVAAVDADDKVLGYRNWLGLNTGQLKEEVEKNGRTFTRELNPNRQFITRNGSHKLLHGRSMLLVRNVGHLMRNPAVLIDGEEIFEGILDAVFTVAAALPGIAKDNALGNSRTGSIYVVKPKQHGPEEVEFTNELLARVEDLYGLDRFTIKVGLMDEERRTSVNLDACIVAAADRVAFINTGFLDRTGDEIHTSMLAGAMIRKPELQTADWKLAYEDNNVDAGLAHGLSGVAQIGKGMWAKTELLGDMLEEKIGQPREGASTAWVPSPTASTLHATHYHEVDVPAVQERLREAGRRDTFKGLLTVPVAESTDWTEEERRHEVENNCQSILGYVIRWVEQGVGCSKVPDINDIDLMEDRATLRISSQILANWLTHGVVSEEFVVDALKRMAKVVDKQNEGDPAYRPMAPDFDSSIGFQAAKDLILEGTKSPSGYTEPILHRRRREFKEREGI